MVVLILIVIFVASALTIVPTEDLGISLGSIINQPIEPLQITSTILIVATLVLLYLEYQDDKKNWRWLVPMALWMFFGLLFYLLLFADRYLHFQVILSYTNWSGILRWYGYITIFLVEYFRWIWHRIKLGKTPDPIYTFIHNVWRKIFHRRIV